MATGRAALAVLVAASLLAPGSLAAADADERFAAAEARFELSLALAHAATVTEAVTLLEAEELAAVAAELHVEGETDLALALLAEATALLPPVPE